MRPQVLVIPSYLVNILPEITTHIQHVREVIVFDYDIIVLILVVITATGFVTSRGGGFAGRVSVVFSEGDSGLEGVADIPAIEAGEFAFSELVEDVFAGALGDDDLARFCCGCCGCGGAAGERFVVRVVGIFGSDACGDGGFLFATGLELVHFVLELFEEGFPDLGKLRAVEFLVPDGNLDAGDEGVVDLADAVGGEEEQAVEIFCAAEEGWTVSMLLVYIA